jgi:hypothetical protein
MQNDGVAFEQNRAVVQHQGRNFPDRIEGKKVRCLCVPGVGIRVDPIERMARQREDLRSLPAICQTPSSRKILSCARLLQIIDFRGGHRIEEGCLNSAQNANGHYGPNPVGAVPAECRKPSFDARVGDRSVTKVFRGVAMHRPVHLFTTRKTTRPRLLLN